MTPELALTELRGGLITVLWVAGPLLLTVLIVGVVVGVVQAATQLNEPTIAFVAKAAALTAVLFALGSLLIGHRRVHHAAVPAHTAPDRIAARWIRQLRWPPMGSTPSA